jgi:hypothetical protein
MSDDQLRKLGEDIKANGLKAPILFWQDGLWDIITDYRIGGLPKHGSILLDGRNRLEAMELVGVELDRNDWACTFTDPATEIISANIHRRHLTKQQIADILVADALKGNLITVEEVSKGGRGKVNEVKAAVVAKAKERGISKPTVERAFTKATEPKPRPKAEAVTLDRFPKRPFPKPRSGKPVVGLEAARRHYLDLCADPSVDLDAEQDIIIDALREIAGKRAMAKSHPLDIPPCLDRRRQKVPSDDATIPEKESPDGSPP